MESARNALPPKRSVSCLPRRAASVGGGGGTVEEGVLNQEKGLNDMADESEFGVFVSCVVPGERGGGGTNSRSRSCGGWEFWRGRNSNEGHYS